MDLTEALRMRYFKIGTCPALAMEWMSGWGKGRIYVHFQAPGRMMGWVLGERRSQRGSKFQTERQGMWLGTGWVLDSMKNVYLEMMESRMWMLRSSGGDRRLRF